MKVVKIFEVEPQSSSILGLNWNVDTDSLIVCRGTEQEIPAKINLHHTNAVFSQKHLDGNGTSMGQRVVSLTLKTIQ